jgi:NAD(P)-dependent dehydrogenase (short-subunit alcohol dehydrogenase family)
MTAFIDHLRRRNSSTLQKETNRIKEQPKDLQLKAKTALVTGSTAGIGFAIARARAREGASVVITGRTQERVDDAIENVRREIRDVKISGIAADLATPDGISKCIQDVPTVDVLVNNLGVYEPKPFEQITDDDWHAIIETNFMSGVRLSRHYLPQMKAANWGRIIFISSESAVNIPVEMIHYGVTKAMQVALARGLAETTAGTAVTVNSVLAGPTRSEGVEKFIADMAKTKNVTPDDIEKEFFRTARPGSLLQRFATADEVAALVVFVASPLSSATNGAALRAEGGVLLSIF